MNGRIGRAAATPAEPLRRSHITDALPPGHPLAHARVYCDRWGFTINFARLRGRRAP